MYSQNGAMCYLWLDLQPNTMFARNIWGYWDSFVPCYLLVVWLVIGRELFRSREKLAVVWQAKHIFRLTLATSWAEGAEISQWSFFLPLIFHFLIYLQPHTLTHMQMLLQYVKPVTYRQYIVYYGKQTWSDNESLGQVVKKKKVSTLQLELQRSGNIKFQSYI